MSDSTFLGAFTLDPRDPEFQDLRSVCEPGNPWRCLIATRGSMELGKRMSVRLDHESQTGVIGLTHGDERYERPMTEEEVKFASRFDLGQQMRKPLTVSVDLGDGSWASKPKRGADGQRPGGPRSNVRNGNAKPHTKTVRARQLEAIRRGTFTPGGGTVPAPVADGRCTSCGYTTVRCAELGCPA